MKRDDACEAMAEKILEDPNMNNPMIPDAIEKQVYKLAIKGTTLLVQAGLGWVVARFVLRSPGKVLSRLFWK
jgi:hypothetical protein